MLSVSEPLRVLIVDDDTQFRRRLEAALEADGITVVGSTADDEAATALTSANHPDIVLLDLDLQSGSIPATSALIRAVPGAKIVILAASDNAPHLFDAVKAGAAAYFLKSRPMNEIIVALRSVRSGMHFINPGLASEIITEFAAMTPGATILGQVPRLTERERAVLELMAGAQPIQEIGRRLSISSNTVKAHVGNVFDKLHLYARTM